MAEPSTYLEQVQRGVDFIESHLDSAFALREVSRTAGMSHWHFQRIFKALTGETLMTYVRARRLAGALERLLHSDAKVLAIALDAGFESQASFTRAFKAAFGITPAAFRKRRDGSLFLQKVRIDADYLRHLNKGVSAAPQLVDHAARRMIGMRTDFYGPDSHKNNLGEQLPPLWDAFMGALPSGALDERCYGVIEQHSADDDLLRYHAAVEVDERTPIPDGMYEVRIPAARYAVFEHRGQAKDVDHTVNYIYSTWLAGSGARHTQGPDLEIYDSRYHASDESSVFEYAIPVSVEG